MSRLPAVRLKAQLWPTIRLLLRGLAAVFFLLILTFYGCSTLSLMALRFVEPPLSTLQLQRQLENLFEQEYRRRHQFVPLSKISAHLQHAVIAAEDSRFFEHNGFDWIELRQAIQANRKSGRRRRGASTISQQLVKNLFLTTHATYLRKGVEFSLTPIAEILLGKERILELYLNIIEWGPGIYGIEAAAQNYYGVSASDLNRDQSARLAACLPAPLHRRPQAMHSYSRQILRRMANRGW